MDDIFKNLQNSSGLQSFKLQIQYNFSKVSTALTYRRKIRVKYIQPMVAGVGDPLNVHLLREGGEPAAGDNGQE